MIAPVVLMALLLVVITVSLIAADYLLIVHKPCRIMIKKEGKEENFEVTSGGTLLSALTDHGIQVPAACGGRGSCGYCKVIVSRGGGDLLATEEAFVSRKEERSGVRLTCQVKVKEDIDITVPDLLTTVKNMAENGTFDTRLKWRFVRKDRPDLVPEECQERLARKLRRQVAEIAEQYRDMPGGLLPALQAVNENFRYLPESALKLIAGGMNIPLSTVFRVATFYNAFSLKPRGKYVIAVCLGTACYVKGVQRILEAFQRELSVEVGNTTKDKRFSLVTVNCLGCCGQSPVLAVNNEIYGYVKLSEVAKIVAKYEGK